jgi:hypothetical protein
MPDGAKLVSLNHGGLDRPYLLRSPRLAPANPVPLVLELDEGGHREDRRSSSAPKKTAALLRIGGFNRSAQRIL